MPTTVVIGANRGIGLELARQLCEKKHRVVATCRTASDAMKELTLFRLVENVDVTGDESVDAFAASMADVEIDNLIINAGILRRTTLSDLDLEQVRAQLEVNAIGPLRIARALHGRIREGGRLAIITSRMGSIADNDSGGAYGYRMSKAAVNAAGKSLSRDLAPRRVAVALLHPGWVKTEMTGNTGNVSAAESAKMLLERVEDLDMDRSGIFWHANGEELPW